MQSKKTIEIELKSGEILTLEMSQRLIDDIVLAFNLTKEEEVTDRHVKYYLASSMKNMLENSDGR